MNMFIDPDEVKKELIAYQLIDEKKMRIKEFETVHGLRSFVCIGKYLFERNVFIALCIIYSKVETSGRARLFRDERLNKELDTLYKTVIDSWRELGFEVPTNWFRAILQDSDVSIFYKFVFDKLFENLDIERSIFQYSDENLALAVLHTIDGMTVN